MRAGCSRVTHPCAGRRRMYCYIPAAPRLACVRPAASVHPEPGSNSSLYILNPSTLDSIKRINALSYCFGTLLVLKSFSIFKQLDLFHFFPKRAAKIRTFFISPNFFTFFFNFFITFVPETYSEWHLTGKYSSSSPRSEPSQ